MVIGNFALLAGLSPQAVAAWFLAVYVDAVEWVELPNVMGMALFANQGRFTSKPYIATGAYIDRMSNYCKGCPYNPKEKLGPSACPFTTLYWRFVGYHQDLMKANPRTALMLKHWEKLDEGELNALEAREIAIRQELGF
jgi:deoxyribodipyrimidine photolyase-related protein